jgi:hypothetical protein
MENPGAIFQQLKTLLIRYQPPLQSKNDTARYFDLWSFKDLVIEGRKRKEVFFAGIIIQKSYVGFYFMPVYAEPEIKQMFQPELISLLKGKSCFHIKQLYPSLLSQIEDALAAGFELYKIRGWV